MHVNGGIGSFFDIDTAFKTNVSAVGLARIFYIKRKILVC